jgi:hypothetical protein
MAFVICHSSFVILPLAFMAFIIHGIRHLSFIIRHSSFGIHGILHSWHSSFGIEH